MSASIVFLIQAVLLAWAGMRKPQAIVAALVAAFFVCALPLVAGIETNRGVIISVQVAIDAAVVLTMLKLWTDYNSMRAWSVSLVGMFKIGVTWAYWSGFELQWSGLIALLDVAFILQILFAGGFVDSLDHLLYRFFPRRARMLRNEAA